jgi:hypothetical protein
LVQVDEGFLKALLGDVFSVGALARQAQRNGENPSLVAGDQNFERLAIPILRRGDERHVSQVRDGIHGSNGGVFSVDTPYTFR